MNLRITRRWFSPQSTGGQLYVDHVFECYTLEDPTRLDPDPATPENEAKVPGATCIPTGRYRIMRHVSPRFGPVLKLAEVPGFTDIYLHAGNTAQDTRGCILVGRGRAPDLVSASVAALDALTAKVFPELLQAGAEVWCQIDAFPLPDQGPTVVV